ncbi:hypothetical protein HYQ44_018087 [Verticillium longisporum]|nr:hypothetical protein HYQ44_018087 [Verticillium longisporum]
MADAATRMRVAVRTKFVWCKAMWRHSISLMSLDKAKINANRFGQKRDFGDPRKWAIVDTKGVGIVSAWSFQVSKD